MSTSHGNVVDETDERILSVFEESDEPVLSTVEVAEHIDMTRQGANLRLQSLWDAGELENKHIGGNALAWWLADG